MLKTGQQSQKVGGGGLFYNIKNKAFTLVELIIVVTIVIILGTIGFMSVGEFTMNARDSVRTSDFRTIQKALELYYLEKGEYPLPDDSEKVESTLNVEGFQGFIEGKLGEGVGSKLRIAQIPKDPVTKELYSYMVSEDKESYLIRIPKEDGTELSIGDIPTSCKTTKELGLFKGNGEYLIYFKTRGPIKVYCNENFIDTDFYQFVLGGDFENDEGFINLARNITFSTDTSFGGNKSLKLIGRQHHALKQFIYFDSSKRYILTGKGKIVRNGGLGAFNLGFIPFDENFQRIYPYFVRIHEGTETSLSRTLNDGDKKVYFYCDDNLFSFLKRKLYYTSRIAYNAEADYSDIPNRNVSEAFGNNTKDTLTLRNSLEKIGGECSLLSLNGLKGAEKDTKIRFHYSGDWINHVGSQYSGDWIDLRLELTGGNQKYLTENTPRNTVFPGTKFLKIEFTGNYWYRETPVGSGKYSMEDATSVTYFDDIKLIVN